jgi:hypothetical protein
MPAIESAAVDLMPHGRVSRTGTVRIYSSFHFMVPTAGAKVPEWLSCRVAQPLPYGQYFAAMRCIVDGALGFILGFAIASASIISAFCATLALGLKIVLRYNPDTRANLVVSPRRLGRLSLAAAVAALILLLVFTTALDWHGRRGKSSATEAL